jgi:hypothetical protein
MANSNKSSIPQPRTLRLSLIPLRIDKNKLQRFLQGLECEDGIPTHEQNIASFSLAPYIDWLVATIMFYQEPLIFMTCRPGYKSHVQLPAELDGATITVDCDFHGITPLYHPSPMPKYDLVAVSGLAAHAFGSWKSPDQPHVMWLRDFLQQDFPDFRVLTWGYDSSLENSITTMTISSFSRQLLTAVRTAREPGPDNNFEV